MAFDQPNSNPPAGGPSQTPVGSSNTNNPVDIPKKQSMSPWDEELPEEEAPKPQKIGGISGVTAEKPPSFPADKAFVVPENIENQTALNVADTSGYKTLDSAPATPAENQSGGVASLVNQPQATPAPGISVPVVPETPVANAQTDADYGDLDIFGDDFSDNKTISSDIKPSSTVAPVPVPSPVATPIVETPAPTQPPISSPLSVNSFAPPPPLDDLAPQTVTPVPVPVIPPATPPVAKKTPLLSLFSRNRNQVSPALAPDSVLIPPAPAANSPLVPPAPIQNGPAGTSRWRLIAIIVGAVLAVIVLLILLTETGVISLGFEKTYNKLGLEVLWGGLPSKADNALGKSLTLMSDKTGFKVTGTVTLAINKSVESPVTTPLVAFNQNNKMAIGYKLDKAILAVSETDYTDPVTGETWTVVPDDTPLTDTSTTDSSTTDTATTDTSATDTSLGDTSTSTEISGDQSLDSSYQDSTLSSDTKEVVAELDGFISKSGNEINLSVNKAGTSDINLKSNADKLWVKSDKIKFNDSAVEGKWLEYSLSTLQGKNLLESFFAGSIEGATAEGTKIKNEKVGKTRCYEYKLDSLSIGNGLSDIGISEGVIQSMSGNVWIGIADKLIHKLDLQIIPSYSSSVQAINVSLEFIDYGKQGTFTAPDATDIITELSTTTTTADETVVADGATTDQIVDQSSTDTTAVADAAATAAALVATNDAKRKGDLAIMKTALTAYKSKYGSYPISTTLLQLSIEPNLLSTKLTPEFLQALPTDPKATEGWYYGYRSLNSKSYYLTAKLENTTDLEAKIVDNIYLYILNNE